LSLPLIYVPFIADLFNNSSFDKEVVLKLLQSVMEDILDDLLEENIARPKKRHGCVTAWLVFMIIANSFGSLANFYLMNIDLFFPEILNEFKLAFIAGGIGGILNVLFAIMLFKWKKNGFYGFIGTSVLMAGVNLKLELGVDNLILGLLGVVILYGLLQIREGKYSTWEQLE